jgi:hypothetical protein
MICYVFKSSVKNNFFKYFIKKILLLNFFGNASLIMNYCKKAICIVKKIIYKIFHAILINVILNSVLIISIFDQLHIIPIKVNKLKLPGRFIGHVKLDTRLKSSALCYRSVKK